MDSEKKMFSENEPNRSSLLGKSVRDMVVLQAERHPGSVFLISPETGFTLSFLELLEYARGISQALYEQGLRHEETVATMLPNGVASALMLLGVMYGGQVYCPLNLAAGNRQLKYVLEHSESRLVFVASELRERCESLLSEMAKAPEMIVIDADNPPFPKHLDTSEITQPETLAGENALLMYTSGTTGLPKGVLLSHQNIISGGMNATESHRLSPTDRALCVLPLYHINGLVNTLFGPLVSWGSVVMPHRFRTGTFWGMIRDFRCSWFSVVPTILSALLNKTTMSADEKDSMSFLRFGRSASAPLAPQVHRQFEEQFGVRIIETMGLTETSSPILANPLPPGTIKYGSPGIAWGNEVRIVDESLHSLPPGKEGQIAVRGPNVMKGYFKNPEETRKTLQNGWLLTGDLGVMDKDGYFFVRGRLKELIIKGGENIAPREIDEALYQHPDVVEAAGFPVEDPHYGQEIEACVTLKDNSRCNEQDLLELCRAMLGEFKAPRRIHFINELPKGPSGKIQRLRLAEIVNSN